MIAGPVVLIRRGSPLGPALDGVPVRVVGPSTVEAATIRHEVAPDDVEAARLWVSRGSEWRGPLTGPDDALAALRGLSGGTVAPDVAEMVARGAETPLGACVVSGGWRYRVAHGGDDPPSRFST